MAYIGVLQETWCTQIFYGGVVNKEPFAKVLMGFRYTTKEQYDTGGLSMPTPHPKSLKICKENCSQNP